MGDAARVALVGANGYGLAHRRQIAPLHESGLVELVGLADLHPVQDEPDAPVPAGAAAFTDYAAMLAATKPDIVIVSTPPHTHLSLASAAVRAGADVLLEKPPFLSLADHDSFAELLRANGRMCQVGFQALGSVALVELTDAIKDGRLGSITGIGTYGGWIRRDSYYARSPWAGRRELDGMPILDGALANPFAHSTMQSIAVAAVAGPTAVEQIELERYRARPIEVDDTGVARLRLASGLTITVAVTLCADEAADPTIIVHGEKGQATLGYTTDVLCLPGDDKPRTVPGRVGLLDNLAAHRADPSGVPLLADLALTRPFTSLIEAIMASPEPTMIDSPFSTSHGSGADRVVTVPGVTSVMRQLADELALPSEVGVAWAVGDTDAPAIKPT